MVHEWVKRCVLAVACAAMLGACGAGSGKNDEEEANHLSAQDMEALRNALNALGASARGAASVPQDPIPCRGASCPGGPGF
jgi:hypothetical protein